MNTAANTATASNLTTGDVVIITTNDRKHPFRGVVSSVAEGGSVFLQLKRGELSLETAVDGGVYGVRWNANPVQVDIVGLSLAN